MIQQGSRRRLFWTWKQGRSGNGRHPAISIREWPSMLYTNVKRRYIYLILLLRPKNKTSPKKLQKLHTIYVSLIITNHQEYAF